jgi:hypothetical protein
VGKDSSLLGTSELSHANGGPGPSLLFLTQAKGTHQVLALPNLDRRLHAGVDQRPLVGLGNRKFFGGADGLELPVEVEAEGHGVSAGRELRDTVLYDPTSSAVWTTTPSKMDHDDEDRGGRDSGFDHECLRGRHAVVEHGYAPNRPKNI